MTVRRFAERKQWPLRGLEARLTMEEAGGRIVSIALRLAFDGDLDDEQRQQLHAAADTCRISRAMAVPVTLA